MENWWVLGAVLATHVKLAEPGFRQKNVRFMLDLLASWRWSSEERRRLPAVHNTQILRRINELVHLGWLKRTSRSGSPHYRLTRAGLVGVLDTLHQEALHSSIETHSFLVYLLDSYKPRLMRLIEAEGTSLPLPQRLDVERILNTKELAKRRRARVKDEIHYWQRRIEENRKIVELVKERLDQNTALTAIVAEIERRYPYELNYNKPLSLLLEEVPQELKAWEITEGNVLRARKIWAVRVRALELELVLLQD